MTPDELLTILHRDRRIAVTAENIDAARQIHRGREITLIGRPQLRSKSLMRIFGVVNPFVELPESEEPQIGDFLHVNVNAPTKER